MKKILPYIKNIVIRLMVFIIKYKSENTININDLENVIWKIFGLFSSYTLSITDTKMVPQVYGKIRGKEAVYMGNISEHRVCGRTRSVEGRFSFVKVHVQIRFYYSINVWPFPHWPCNMPKVLIMAKDDCNGPMQCRGPLLIRSAYYRVNMEKAMHWYFY